MKSSLRYGDILLVGQFGRTCCGRQQVALVQWWNHPRANRSGCPGSLRRTPPGQGAIGHRHDSMRHARVACKRTACPRGPRPSAEFETRQGRQPKARAAKPIRHKQVQLPAQAAQPATLVRNQASTIPHFGISPFLSSSVLPPVLQSRRAATRRCCCSRDKAWGTTTEPPSTEVRGKQAVADSTHSLAAQVSH